MKNFLFNIKDFNNTGEVCKQDLYLLFDGILNTNIGSSAATTILYIYFNTIDKTIIDFLNTYMRHLNQLYFVELDININSYTTLAITNVLDEHLELSYLDDKTVKQVNINYTTDYTSKFDDLLKKNYFLVPWYYGNVLDGAKIPTEPSKIEDILKRRSINGHTTCLLISKQDDDIYDIYLINSGQGLDKYHKMEKINNIRFAYPIVFRNVNRQKVSLILNLSLLFIRKFKKEYACQSDIHKLYEILIKITNVEPQNCKDFMYMTQLSGSCSFYSIKYCIDYYLELTGNHTKIKEYTKKLETKSIDTFRTQKDEIFCWDTYNLFKIIENKYNIKMYENLDYKLFDYIKKYNNVLLKGEKMIKPFELKIIFEDDHFGIIEQNLHLILNSSIELLIIHYLVNIPNRFYSLRPSSFSKITNIIYAILKNGVTSEQCNILCLLLFIKICIATNKLKTPIMYAINAT